jgi:hypothetical protein
MAVRLSALCADRPFNPQEDSWHSFLLEAEATVRLEGLGKLKKNVSQRDSILRPSNL